MILTHGRMSQTTRHKSFTCPWTKSSRYYRHATTIVRTTLPLQRQPIPSLTSVVGEYLKLHPEEAHELMIPPTSPEFWVRHCERLLVALGPICTETGVLDEAKLQARVFATLLPGKPKVISNPHDKPHPSWREVVGMICGSGGSDQPSYKALESENKVTGDRLRAVEDQDS